MPVPCGSLNEIDEIKEVIKNDFDNDYEKTYYKINYLGHGCLLLASTLDELRKVKFVARHLPEALPNLVELLNKGIK